MDVGDSLCWSQGWDDLKLPPLSSHQHNLVVNHPISTVHWIDYRTSIVNENYLRSHWWQWIPDCRFQWYRRINYFKQYAWNWVFCPAQELNRPSGWIRDKVISDNLHKPAYFRPMSNKSKQLFYGQFVWLTLTPSLNWFTGGGITLQKSALMSFQFFWNKRKSKTKIFSR